MTRKANKSNKPLMNRRTAKARRSRTQKRTMTGGAKWINAARSWWARRKDRQSLKKLGVSGNEGPISAPVQPGFWNRTKKNLGAFRNSAKSAAFLARFPIMHRNGNIHLDRNGVSVKYFILLPGQNTRTKLNNIKVQLSKAAPKLELTSVPDNIKNSLLKKYEQYKDMFQFVESYNAYDDDSPARIFVYGFKNQDRGPEQQGNQPEYLVVESSGDPTYIDPNTLIVEEPEVFTSAELPVVNLNNRKSSNKPSGLRMTNTSTSHPLQPGPNNNI